MDSLSQIVLGAAMGEVAAGKKLGNRAMVWGAIAGTIPDLDIIANTWMPYIDALAAHRGMSHSIVFAVFFSALMALFCRWLYDQPWTVGRAFKWTAFILGTIFSVLIGTIIVAFTAILINKYVGIILAIPLIYLSYKTIKWQYRNYLTTEKSINNVDFNTWYLLFFLAIFTHPILDSCTVYGTQLFWPFSNMRVAWNIVSVADPAYTVPFLFFLLMAAYTLNNYKKRSLYNWLGIGYSLLYLVMASVNKLHYNRIAENTIKEMGLDAKRYMTNPTILNNILWSTTIETDSSYYQGLYSRFDKEKVFKLSEVPKNHNLIEDNESDYTIKILKWFSADYYSLIEREDGLLQLNDMRYGTFRGEANGENDYIFKFVLDYNESCDLEVKSEKSGPPENDDPDNMLSDLISRIKGI